MPENCEVSDTMMPQRTLGASQASAIALGGARWSLVEVPDDQLAAATIRAALAEGITLFDTARAYTTVHHQSHNEALIAEVLAVELAEGAVIISTKGGHGRAANGEFYVDARPETLRRHCDESLQILGIDRIPLYSLHWPDKNVPLTESVGALADLRTAGKVEMIGVCNVSTDQLVELRTSVSIDAVQHRFSPLDQSNRELVSMCAAAGIPFLAYSPFGGAAGAPTLGNHPGIASVASRRRASPYQVAIAWLLHHPGVVPIVGAGRPGSINGIYAGISLTDDEAKLITDSSVSR